MIFSIFTSFALSISNPVMLDNSAQDVSLIDVSNNPLLDFDHIISPDDESDNLTPTSGTIGGISREADAFDSNGDPSGNQITASDMTDGISSDGEQLDFSDDKTLVTLSDATARCDTNAPYNRHRTRRDSSCIVRPQPFIEDEGSSSQKSPYRSNQNQNPYQNQRNGGGDPNGAGAPIYDSTNLESARQDEKKCPPNIYGPRNYPVCASSQGPIRTHHSPGGVLYWVFNSVLPCMS